MSKARWLKWTNMILFFSAAIQAATGAALLFDLLGSRLRLLALAMDLHELNGPLLVLLLIAHVSLNWGWVRSQLCRKAAAPAACSHREIRQPSGGGGRL